MSVHESLARERKSARLALFLQREFGADALRAAAIATEAQWDAIAVSAGTEFPGERTRALVRELLAPVVADPNAFLTARARRTG